MSLESFFDRLPRMLVKESDGSFRFTDGSGFRQIYTYDRRPVSDKTIGSRFDVRITRSVRSLKSSYSGDTWGRDRNGVAFTDWLGQPFAALNNEHLASLTRVVETELHAELHATARIDSWFDEYEHWPSIQILAPGDQYIGGMADILHQFHRWPVSGVEATGNVKERERSSWVHSASDLLQVNTRDAEHAVSIWISPDKAERCTDFMRARRRWSGTCHIELVPPAAGSRAKPRLRLITGVTAGRGTLVYETRNRRKEYDMFYSHRSGIFNVALNSPSHGYYELIVLPMGD